MEEKLKRECKPWLEKLFKANDELGSGSVTQQGMRRIVKEIVVDFEDEELNELMKELATRTKYTVLNKQTNKFDVQYLENSIDFPSALYICVHFLVKLEKRNNPNSFFSGKSEISFRSGAGIPGTGNPPQKIDAKNDKRRFF